MQLLENRAAPWETACVWGLPLACLTRRQAVEEVGRSIEAGKPSYFITVNLNYAMLSHRHEDLRSINRGAAFLLADGMPLVWASRWKGTPLPERVAGSDLIYDLCELAARRRRRIFLLGGAPGVADQAAEALRERYPGIQVVGTIAPPYREPTAEETEALVARIRASGADLLFVAFGQPKGERWIARHRDALGVPVCVQVGASLDFVAGRVRRAPRWTQSAGLEWAYRLWLEPGRLLRRYSENALFFLKMIVKSAVAGA